MERSERWRIGSVAALIVVAIAGMAIAVADDVACELDCAPDEDVTWGDALAGAGTGLSPPAFLVVVVALVAALAMRRDRWGTVALVVQLLLAALMLFAGFADAGTIKSLRGEHGARALAASVLLVLAVLATGATAALSLRSRRRP